MRLFQLTIDVTERNPEARLKRLNKARTRTVWYAYLFFLINAYTKYPPIRTVGKIPSTASKAIPTELFPKYADC